MKKINLFLVFATLCTVAFSQSVVQEKTYKLNKSSKKGYLSVVRTDDDREEISLVYNTKEKKKKTKFDNYIFDYDFNLTWEESGEEPKFKSKRKKSKYRGEDYEYDEVTLEANLTGVLKAKVKHVNAKWSGFFGDYLYKKETIKNEKLRNENNRKLYYRSQCGLESGEALVLVAPKHKPADIKTKAGIQHLIKVDANLDIVQEETFDLNFESGLVTAWSFEEKYIAIYAPVKIMGGPKCKDGSEYKIVIIDKATAKVESITKFNSKVGDWNVLHAQESSYGYTFVGPGNVKSATKVNGFATQALDKFDAFQVVHINGKNEVKIGMSTNDDINAKAITFPGEKKPISYNGKKYDFIGVEPLFDGSGLVVGMQDYKTNKDGSKTYKEMIFLHFDISGILHGYYAIPSEAKRETAIGSKAVDIRSFPIDFMVLPAKNPSHVNLLIIQPHHTEMLVERDWGADYEVRTYTPMLYPRFVQIDTEAKEFSVVKEIGDQKYFLYDRESIQIIKGGQEFLFLGESRNDRTLYMARFSLD